MRNSLHGLTCEAKEELSDIFYPSLFTFFFFFFFFGCILLFHCNCSLEVSNPFLSIRFPPVKCAFPRMLKTREGGGRLFLLVKYFFILQ